MKTEMAETLRKAIGPLDLTEVKEAEKQRDNVREQIAGANAEIETLESKLSELTRKPITERLGEAAAAGGDLDAVEAEQGEMTERLGKLRHRVEILGRQSQRYESRARLAWDLILSQVEGAIDRVRGNLSPELTAIFQEAEKFNASWQTALRETLREYKMSPHSFNRAEETLAVYPAWDANLLPLTMWLIPNILIKNRGIVEPPIPTRES